MAYGLGKAYIQIVPKADGMGRGIEKELAGVGSRAGSSKGNGLGGKLWKGLKVGAGVAGAAIGGVLAGSVAKGFQRLSAIEQAEAKLTGLGHSAEEVEKIMDSALAAVKGTAYGMGDAASIAATMVAAGIEPGEELENTLRLVADSATIAGRDITDVGLIWSQVASKGKLQGQDAMQLMEAGIPIWQLIGKEMGVTAEEAQELGSKGEVSFDIFRRAMEEGVGGAALESGKTVQGAFANMGAAMGRFGAAILKDLYPMISPLLGKITELFDYLTDAAGPAIDRVVEAFKEWAASDQVQGFLGRLREVARDLWENALLPLWEKGLKPFGEWWLDQAPKFMPTVGKLATALAAVVAAIVGGGLAVVVGQFVASMALVAGVIWPALTAVVDLIQNRLWPVMQTVFEAVKNLAIQVWQGVVLPAFQQFTDYVQTTVMPIVQRLWIEYIQPTFAAIGAAAKWLWENAIKPAFAAIVGFVSNTLGPILVWLWENVVSPVFTWIGNAIAFAVNNVVFPVLGALKALLTNVIGPAFKWLWETVKTVWSGIQRTVQAVVSWFQTWVWPVISLVIELIKLGFNALRSALKTAWDFIKNNVINPVVTWFRDTAWPILSRVIDSVKTGFNRLRDSLRDAWAFIKNNVINPVATWFRDTVKPLFDTATEKVGKAFDTLKDTVGKAWDGIRDKAKEPIRFVVDTVINSALIGNFNKVAKKLGVSTLPSVSLPSGFARGGILPGMSRMRDGDDQLVPMRRGEGVLVSEGLRTRADRAAFLAANAAGRRGIGFASLMQGGFAGGGIWDGIKGGASKAWKGTKNVAGKAKDLAGDALDKVLDGVDFVAEALKDPASIFRKVYNAVVGKIPAAGLVTEAAKGAGSKLLTGIIDKAKGIIAPSFEMPDLSAVKAGGSLAMARTLAASFGLTMTSYKRGGARTAGSGAVSLHALGRAMDFSNSTGPTPQMMAFFNAMHQFKPTELLYSPAGARQWRRSGRMADTTGATKRMHYNHVHVGFADGGILGKPFLHDQGGWHNPGQLSINQTRKPEAVLTNGQWKAVESLVNSSTSDGQAPQIVNYVTATNDKAKELVDSLMWAQRTQARRGRYATVGR